MRRNSLPKPLLFLCLVLLLAVHGYSQDSSSLFHRLLSFPDKVFGKIDKEANKYEQKLTQQTDKYLNKLQRQEEKLKRKLWRTDSTKAKEVFGDVKGRYDGLRNKLNEQTTTPAVYNGRLDSLGTAINFLQNNPQVQQVSLLKDKLGSNFQSISSLQTKLNQTEQIRKQIQQRQQQLKQQLQNTPLAKEFRKFKKEVYYYQAQVKEYQEALKDPKKLGGKLLQAANKLPAFREFLQKHSYLATMFRMPSPTDPGYAANMAGLQTRADLSAILNQQVAAGGPNAQQQFQQQIQTAQQEIQKLKAKILPQGGSSDEPMPDPIAIGFKPNNQKTKSFLERIEWGSNLQTSKGNFYFPVTSDIGVSAGYKLNDKSIIGIGASYKVGLGQSWQHINITHQGAGIRSFVDIKLKGSFWISGGGELNYRNEFRRIEVLKELNAWQQSALIGISKKYKVGKRMKGNAQLLYDFLWKQQTPRTQAVVFRVGYNF